MKTLTGIKVTRYGGLGYINHDDVYEICSDYGSSINFYSDGLENEPSKTIELDKETSEKIMTHAKTINLYEEVKDVAENKEGHNIIDISSTTIEFIFHCKDTYSIWSETYSICDTLSDTLDVFLEYLITFSYDDNDTI